MNAQTLARISTILVIFLIVVGGAPVCAVDQTPSSGGEKAVVEGTAHQKVNINTADTARLSTLTGVGTQLAKRITEYRKQNGPFQKPEDIMQVKGIGQKVFNQNKDRIVLK